MKLNHVNIAVPDVAATRAFFEKQVTPQYPRDFHLGFLLRESVNQVNELYERLKDSGIETAPPKKFHGSWGFYVVAPGGITVEVSSYPEEASAR